MYKDKLAELRKLGSPAEQLAAAASVRDDAATKLQNLLDEVGEEKKLLASAAAPEAEGNNSKALELKASFDEITSWFEGVKGEQEKKAKWDEPSFSESDVLAKYDLLKVTKIMRSIF